MTSKKPWKRADSNPGSFRLTLSGRYALIMGFVLLADGLSKQWAGQLFGGAITLLPNLARIRVIHHRGGLFGLIQPHDPQWPLHLISGLVLAFFVALALRTPAQRVWRHRALAWMAGGALANWLDRIIHGFVIDFLELGPLPTINLADLAIFTGLLFFYPGLTRTPP